MPTRKNSITLTCKNVTIVGTSAPLALLHITLAEPNENDLIRIIAEASSFLEWKRKRAALKETS